MAHLATLDARTWCLLWLLPALLAILALVFRRPVWTHVLAFSLAALATGTGESVYNVYVLRNIDPKFYRAPDAAFELEMGVLPFLVAASAATFGATLALLMRLETRRRRSHSLYLTLVLVLLGSAMQPLFKNALLAWAWILLFPILCASLLFSRRAPAEETIAYLN